MARRGYAQLEGQADLKQAFAALGKEATREVKDVTRTSLDEIRRGAMSRIPTGPGKMGKHTRDTFTRKIDKGGLSGEVGSTWFIARLREFGHNIVRRGKSIGVRGKKASRANGKTTISAGNSTVVGHAPARPALFPAFELVRSKYPGRISAALYAVMRNAGGR